MLYLLFVTDEWQVVYQFLWILLFAFICLNRKEEASTRQMTLILCISVLLLFFLFYTSEVALFEWFITHHMVQLSIFLFISPLIVLQFFSLTKNISKNLFYWIIGIFSVLLLFYHIPQFLFLLHQIPYMHDLFLSILFLLSFFCWRCYLSIPRSNGFMFSLIFLLALLPACLSLVSGAFLSPNALTATNLLSNDICFVPVNSFKIDLLVGAAIMFVVHKLCIYFGRCTQKSSLI